MAIGKHESVIRDTKDFLVKDGKSDYKIVIQKNASDLEKEAANELVLFLKKATGVELEIISDQEIDCCGKYLSVGKNAIWEKSFAGETFETLGKCGFQIRTVNGNVYMWGDRDHGTLYSAHEFLKYEVGFGAYIPSEIYTDTCDTVIVKEFCVTEIPDFEFLLANYGFERYSPKNCLFGRRVRMMPEEEEMILVNGRPWHNTMQYLPPSKYKEQHPKWYSNDGKQICFNAHGDEQEEKLMFDAFMETFLGCLEAYPERETISITQEDVFSRCNCPACTAAKEKYGADSANLIKFCNKVSRATKKYFEDRGIKRKLNILFFAYQKSIEPPVKQENGRYVPTSSDVVCEDNVMCYYAPGSMHHGKPFTSEVNKKYAEIFDKWSVLCKNVRLWLYCTNYSDYLVPFDAFGAIQENYRFAKEHNTDWILDLGQFNQNICTGFDYFKAYLTAKLSWNVNEDVEALTDDFFTHVYKDAAKEMKMVFYTLRQWTTKAFDVLGMDGSMYFDNTNSLCWPRKVLEDLMGKLDDAYKAIEPLQTKNPDLYKSLYWRICLESIPYRKLFYTIYRNTWLTDGMIEEDMNKIVNVSELKNDIEDLRIARGAEASSIENHLANLLSSQPVYYPFGCGEGDGLMEKVFGSGSEYFKEEGKMRSCPI